jgi:FkbH-like protein
MDFLTLKKNLKKEFKHFPIYKLAILGDTSTQLLNQALRGFAYNEGINFEIYESDYDQIDLNVFINDSGLYSFNPDFILIFHSSQKLLVKYQKSENKISFGDDHINYVGNIIDSIKSKLKSKIIYSNFPELNDGIFGNFSNHLEQSFVYQLRKINFNLMNLTIKNKNFHINDMSLLNNVHGFNFTFNNKQYINSDLAINLDYLPFVAKNIVDIIKSVNGKIKKCIILDLDNTLWGGVIGDDGLNNIHIGQLGIGKAFTLFQSWIKQLKERGIILAICSKNTDSIAKEPFLHHPEMILKLEDISVFVANWDNKADNIRHIKNVLNIGFDSMVFIDDNPFERELVKRELPEIEVPTMPKDPADYISYLIGLNLFEIASFSEEDIARNQMYKIEAERILFKEKFTSEEDYLKGLEMKSVVTNFNEFNIPRVAQLTQRSNQFNLTTYRYSDEDIREFSINPNYLTLSFSLSDIYGDNGLISVVIIKRNLNNFIIDTWVMSCRVLKRGMEQFILNQIINRAKAENIDFIEGKYIKTQKNEIVKDLYKELGFIYHGETWVLEVSKSVELKTYINEN